MPNKNNEIERELKALKEHLRDQFNGMKQMPIHRKTRNNTLNKSKYTLISLIFLLLFSSFIGAGYHLFKVYDSNTKFLSEHAEKSKQLNLETKKVQENFDKSVDKVSGWSPLGKGYEKMIAAEQDEKESDHEPGYSGSYSGSYSGLSRSSRGGYVRSYTRRDGTHVRSYYRGGGGRRR
jgi:hypothetical protein